MELTDQEELDGIIKIIKATDEKIITDLFLEYANGVLYDGYYTQYDGNVLKMVEDHIKDKKIKQEV